MHHSANTPYRLDPVQENQVYDVEITAIGDRGDGITRIDNLVVFVRGTNTGDKCRIKITKRLERYAVAEVMEAL